MDNPASSSSAVPARTSLRPVSMAQRPNSRPTSSSIDHAHPLLGRVKTQPASPEVISSLISSLSAISTPAEDHFENLLNGDSANANLSPSSPAATSTTRSERSRSPGSPTKHGFGMDYGAYRNVTDGADSALLHPDDAAIAPVVRLSKVPVSAWSSRPVTLEHSASPGRLTPRMSRSSLNSEHSIGILSSEPGPQVSSPTSTSTSSGKRRSSRRLVKKNSLELMKKRSMEFLGDKSPRWPNRTASAQGLGVSGEHNTPNTKTDAMDADLIEQPDQESTPESMKLNEEHPADADHAPTQSTPAADVEASPNPASSARAIPTRESSLRHSYSGSPSTKKRRSGRHSRYSSAGSKDLKIDQDLVEGTGEQQTVRRIEELKAQKKRREDEMQREERAGRTKSKSPGPTPVLAPHRVSSLPDTRRRSRQSAPEVSSKIIDEPSDDDESAPAPAVYTHKSRAPKRNSSGPLTSKAGNIQTPKKFSFDQDSRSNSRLKQRPSRPSTPKSLDKHQRTFSTPLSPTGRVSLGNEERPSSADSIDDAVDAFLSSPRLTQRIAHPQTGRVVAFSEVGDPNGYAVICCVGMGLTRYLTAFYDELAWTLKLRLITPDRPGVGESQPSLDGTGTPLSWPDDVALICAHLKITKFSVLAHSAGAIYALATALRMPQQIRGRLHLMAPWIPPSQMSGIGSHKEPLPANALPYSQRILRALPTPFLKAANSSFMSATSASITSSLPKSPRKTKRKSLGRESGPVGAGIDSGNAVGGNRAPNGVSTNGRVSGDVVGNTFNGPANLSSETAVIAAAASTVLHRERQTDYDNRLTTGIWDLATTNANPAVDLLVCLERRQPIGFRYVDITRAIVIHHGSRDTRVPVENVKWLGKTMRRCEVRILEGEGHGLMASAAVMGNVLMEMAKEWEDWNTIVQGKKEGRRNGARERLHDMGH